MIEDLYKEGGLHCQCCGRLMRCLCIVGGYDHGYHLCWSCAIQECKPTRRSPLFIEDFKRMLKTEKPY